MRASWILASLAVALLVWAPNTSSAQAGPVYDRTTAIDAGQFLIKDLDVAAASSSEALFVHHKVGLGVVDGGVGYVLTGGGVPGSALMPAAPGLSGGLGGEDANVAFDRSGERYLMVWAQGDLYARWYDAGASLLGPVAVIKEKVVISRPGEPSQTQVADKPWLSAGLAQDRMGDPSRGVFYVCFLFGQQNGDYWFARSGRGGDDGTWLANRYRDAGGAFLGTGHPFTQGSVARNLGDRPWIVAQHGYRQDRYNFLRFDDATRRFEELLDATPTAGPLTMPVGEGLKLNDLIPGPYSPKVVPFVAADPTTDDRFYVVFYREFPADSGDVDVVCITFERDPTFAEPAGWRRVRTRTMNPTGSATSVEFNPAAVVDDSGRLHVAYYGHDESDPSFHPLRFHFFHAYSEDHGNTFSDPVDLSTATPTLPSGVGMSTPAGPDWTLLPAIEPTFPGEYPALEAVTDAQGITVWIGWGGNVDGQDVSIGSIVESLREGETDGPGYVVYANRVTWSSQVATSPPPCPTVGPNPRVLLADPVGGPVTGGTWRPTVDHGPPLNFQAGFDADIVFVQPALDPPLCDPPRGIRLVPIRNPVLYPRVAPIEIPIPDDLALVGMSFVCQVVSYDAGLSGPSRFRWTNGLEILVAPGDGL